MILPSSSPLSPQSSRACALESDFLEAGRPVVVDEVTTDSPLALEGRVLGTEATAGDASTAGFQRVHRDEDGMTLKGLFFELLLLLHGVDR